MNWLFRRIALHRKRKALAAAQNMLLQVEDQIASGAVFAKKLRQKIAQLSAEANALEEPDDIVRRAGVA